MTSRTRLTVLALVLCISSSIATIVLGFEVHGLIAQKWQSLGGANGFLGEPLTNETTTPDGVGRFNHFQGGSIYWTPKTGAHEVHGQIRNKWQSLRWERGPLGYPISDEFQAGAFRRSNFQHGFIRWSAKTGALVSRSGNID
jgi:uncharacterized protein with LGFP repeats